MPITVYSKPNLRDMRAEESGIKRVIENYHKYAPDYGIVYTDDINQADITASHAGTMINTDCLHSHGIYWSADYEVAKWELQVNAQVIASARHALTITVPSSWVAETFQRDMRVDPFVVPHGIDWQDWRHDYEPEGYVLWNKNRNSDVCNPYPVGRLADKFTGQTFITTFAPDNRERQNVYACGVIPHAKMKELIQRASVYLATTKETFGIGILEAMAAGVPVLGFANGGITDLVEHLACGYLAEPNNYDDLELGLQFCIQNRAELGANGREMVKRWTWASAVENLAGVYQRTLELKQEHPNVSVVIPSYNYGTEEQVGRAIDSALNQTYRPELVIVVDDGSPDDGATRRIVEDRRRRDPRVRYIRQDNRGVAHARNRGISTTRSKYVVCLDADDAIEPGFLKVCVAALEQDRTLGIAYTGLQYIKPDGSTGVSQWPGAFDYQEQIKRHNQVPTCAVFRREMWARLGGYNQKYAPRGAGAEDAEFWLRAGAYGYNARQVTEGPLFVYSWMSGHVTSDKNYREVDWTAMHPWTKDNQPPFASIAKPENGFSHLVRQYDQPAISVIIPVGANHVQEFVHALNSLEAQTMRRWEAIVVLDGVPILLDKVKETYQRAYPYVRWECTSGRPGAGSARNIGANMARAPLLLFLDADDWLYPEALQKMLSTWNATGNIVYSDYVGKAYLDPGEARKLGDRLLYYDEKTGEAVIKHYSADFDCPRAIRQPDEVNQDTYIWCLITSLVPKVWHVEINGFDETLNSWEDWDYWIRMARAGRCFERIKEDLVVYRFYTGSRRESGLASAKKLLEYLISKKDGNMGCNCPQPKKIQPITMKIVAGQRAMEAMMQDESMILVDYRSPNIGQHQVVGGSTKTRYGYRSGGERFYVHKDDIASQPNLFVPVPPEPAKAEEVTRMPTVKKVEFPSQPESATVTANVPVSATVTANVPAPVVIKMEPESEPELHLLSLPGITDEIAAAMYANGIDTESKILKAGVDGLQQIKGIGKVRAMAIIAYIKGSD